MTSGRDMLEMDPRLADFEARLAAYGADLGRWPAAQRAAAEALMTASPEARRLIGEAMALERVLDAGAETLPVAHAQVDRVLAAALAARPETVGATVIGGSTATVVRLRGRDNSKTVDTDPQPVRRTSSYGGGTWRAAAVLAFALVTGVAIGALDVAPTMMASVGDLVGLTSDSDLVVAAIPVDGLDALLDEDHL